MEIRHPTRPEGTRLIEEENVYKMYYNATKILRSLIYSLLSVCLCVFINVHVMKLSIKYLGKLIRFCFCNVSVERMYLVNKFAD